MARDSPLAVEHLADGDLASAQRELAAFVRRNPHHNRAVQAREMLGRSFMAPGRLDAASHEYTLILQEMPANVEAQRALIPAVQEPVLSATHGPTRLVHSSSR